MPSRDNSTIDIMSPYCLALVARSALAAPAISRQLQPADDHRWPALQLPLRVESGSCLKGDHTYSSTAKGGGIDSMTAGHLRRLAVAGLIAAAVLGACWAIWWFSIGELWSPKTAILQDFQRFCVATGAQRGAVIIAVAGASDIEEVPTYDAPKRFRPMSEWTHTVGAEEVGISTMTMPPADGETKPETVCGVFSDDDHGASLAGLRAWLSNAPPTTRRHRKMSMDEYYFTLENGRPHVFAPNDDKGRELARKAGALFNLHVFYGADAISLQLAK